jgi:hypothetical protein
VTGSDVRFDQSSSTLPRTAGRHSKGHRQSDVHHPSTSHDVGSQHQSAANYVALQSVDVADPSFNKRRSAVASSSHSYRMQTESSLAKVNAGKESIDPVTAKNHSTRKESLGANRFQSTPNLIEATPDDENSGDSEHLPNKWSAMSSADDDSFGKVSLSAGLDALIANRRSDAVGKTDLNRSKTFSGSSRDVTVVKTMAAGLKTDRSLMPPPATGAVPTSIQAAFIAKAEKHRRSAVPDVMLTAQTKDGVNTADKVPSDVGGSHVSVPSNEMVLQASGVPLRNSDASPLEPPERDVVTPSLHGLSELQAITRRLTDLGSQLTTVSTSAATSTVSKDPQPSSPRVVKIGRCTSPLRPYVAKTTPTTPVSAQISVSFTQNDVRPTSSDGILSGPMHRRQLPADPKSGEKAFASSVSSASPERRSMASGLTDTALISSSARPGSESIVMSSGRTSSVNSHVTSHSAKLGVDWSTLGGNNISTDSTAATPSTAMQSTSASILETSSSVLTMKRPQAQQQWDQMLHPLPDTTVSEAHAPPPHLVYEIEKFCEERRRSKDHNIAERLHSSDGSAASSPSSSQHSSIGSQHLVESGADARVQWDKARQMKPFALKSSSNAISKPLSASGQPFADEGISASVNGNAASSLGRRASSGGSASSDVREAPSPSPLESLTAVFANSRRSAHRSTPDGFASVQPSRRSRAQQLLNHGANAGGEEPKEGEPSNIVQDANMALRLATQSPSFVTLPTAAVSHGYVDWLSRYKIWVEFRRVFVYKCFGVCLEMCKLRKTYC